MERCESCGVRISGMSGCSQGCLVHGNTVAWLTSYFTNVCGSWKNKDSIWLVCTYKVSTPLDAYIKPPWARLKGCNNLERAVLRRSLSASPELVLTGLCAPFLGPDNAKLLIDHYNSIWKIISSPIKELETVLKDAELALDIRRFLNQIPIQDMLLEMEALGVQVTRIQPTQEVSAAGLNFVFTGTLSSMTRKQAEARVSAAGGFFSSTVRRHTDILVVGNKPGGTKLADGLAYGVKTIGEAEFLQMV